MRRRDFTIGLLLAVATQSVRAQGPPKQHRIAIITPAGPVAAISDTGPRAWPAFFDELRRLGDVEGQNLTIERYSGEGRPERYVDLAREVVNRNPDVIVAITTPIAEAARAANGAIPIVWIGVETIGVGLVTSLARPGGNITGVNLYDYEIWGKRLQILKEAVPAASKVAFLLPRRTWENVYGQLLREISRRLEISLIGMPLDESTPSEYKHVFAKIAPERPDAIIVHDIGDLVPYRHLIVELVEKSRLPAMYGWRDYVEAGGLMAYEADLGEARRRMADDAADLVDRQVDVIVTEGGDSSAFAAKRATSTIPIVFHTGTDPFESDLVTSLARPGGNLTGVSLVTTELMPKLLELLSELVPQARVIALLVNPNGASAEPQMRTAQEAARTKGLELRILKAGAEGDFEAAFASLVQQHAGALVVGSDPFLFSRRKHLMALASRDAVPAIYPRREFAAAGGLLSYGTSFPAAYRLKGTYVGKILKGAKPADLPVQQPTTFELVINLKTAKALGLTVPPSILARADEVIE